MGPCALYRPPAAIMSEPEASSEPSITRTILCAVGALGIFVVVIVFVVFLAVLLPILPHVT